MYNGNRGRLEASMGFDVEPGVYVNREPHAPSSRSKGNASIPRPISPIPSCSHRSPIIHLYLLSFIIIMQSRSISGTHVCQEVASDCLLSGPICVISCILIFRQVISSCFWKKKLILQVSEECWLFSNTRNSSIIQPKVGLDSILDQASGPALLGGNWVPFRADGESR